MAANPIEEQALRTTAFKLDLPIMLESLTESATQMSGAMFGAFFDKVCAADGNQHYQLRALAGAPREEFERLGMPSDTPVFDATFRGEGVIRCADLTRHPNYRPHKTLGGMTARNQPVRSYLAAPVISRAGEVLGGLFLGHPHCNVFSERTEQLILGICSQAAIAIDNARLYEAAQQEIRRREHAEAALRDSDRRKDEFLATLAHELRNPLAPIRQAALIAKTPTATEAQRRWSHDVIERQVHHMALLLDDLLDISRVSRGELALRTEMTDLAAIIDTAIETARPRIDSKRHALSIEMPAGPVRIEADATRLAQVISNLLNNAAKYTDPDGRICLRVERESDAVIISVSDNGIGIPAAAIGDLFKMFSQVKSAQDRSDGGLGIGLALAKGLVALHGGTLQARSGGPGQGSEFIVRLPAPARAAPTAEAPNDAPSAPPQRVRRLLIADDNEDAAESLAALLRLDGHDVTVVGNGQQALEAIGLLRPDVALLDIGMPDISGYEVARRLREAPQNGQHGAVMLIAVTGWGQERDKREAREAGFDHHLTKPIEPDALLALLRPGDATS
jgi:signal transduction histidine kinase/CheY-like chemotaxis protein